VLLDSAVPDPAVAAGTALGSFLSGLAGSGPIGALIAAGLTALVIIHGTKLVREVRNPPRAGDVTVTPEALDAAADRAGLAGRGAADECKALTGRVEALEDWQVAHAHQHELEAVADRAREEGARAEREHTNPGTGRRR